MAGMGEPKQGGLWKQQRRWCRYSLSALLLIAAFGARASAWGEGAREVESLPWLVAAVRSGNDDERFKALETLWSLGIDARPAVLVMIRALQSPNSFIRGEAASALGAAGLEATAAIPQLVDTLGDDGRPATVSSLVHQDVGRLAALALGCMGPDAVGPLRGVLASTKTSQREDAIYALGMIGADAAAAVPDLIAALSDGEPEVRRRAAYALGQIGAPSRDSTPVLIEGLQDIDLGARVLAAEALGMIRPPTAAAIEALAAVLRGNDVQLKARALDALGNLGKDAAPAVPAIAALLSSEEAFLAGHPALPYPVAMNAARALAAIGPAAKEAVPDLIAAVRDAGGTYTWLGISKSNLLAREGAVRALVQVAPEDRKIIPVLRDALDQDDWVSTAAAGALATFGPRAATALPQLLKTMEKRKSRCQLAAAAAIVTIQPNRAQAMEVFFEGLSAEQNYPDAEDWMIIQAALDALPDERHRAIPSLIRLMRLPSFGYWPVRRGAAQALGNMGPAAAQAIPALVDALDDDVIQPDVISALSRIATAQSAELTHALKNRSGEMSAAAATVLGHFPQAVPALIEASQDQRATVRAAAAAGLGNLGADAQPARSELERLLGDEYRTVQEAAQRALNQIAEPTPGKNPCP